MVQLFWVLGHIIVFITVIAEKVGGGGGCLCYGTRWPIIIIRLFRMLFQVYSL